MKTRKPRAADASSPSRSAENAESGEVRLSQKTNEPEMQAKLKIGILTCSTMTRILDCPVGACLSDLQERRGSFAEYQGMEIELAGVTSCNGCATRVASAVVPKVESLVHYGADRVHLSYCLLALCPFRERYVQEIRRHFKDLKIVLGTHESHQSDDQFRREIEAKLNQRRQAIIP